MKKEVLLKTCYSLLRNTTPLDYDCGKICGGKCCKGDNKTGMLLFPGEEKLIDSNMKIIENDIHVTATAFLVISLDKFLLNMITSFSYTSPY